MENQRWNLLMLGIFLLLTAGLLTLGVLGTRTMATNRAACDAFADSRYPLYERGKVTLDQGMKMAARRARRAARITSDTALKRAFLDFAKNAEGRTWRDSDDASANQYVGLVLSVCSLR
jgi:hypothetical protein